MKYSEIKETLKPYSKFSDIPDSVLAKLHREDLDLIRRIIKDGQLLKEYKNFRKTHCICVFCDKIFLSDKRQSWNTHCDAGDCIENAQVKKSLVDNKRKETNIKKYGCENISQSQAIKNKKATTCKKNYGVDNPPKSQIVKERIKNSNLIKYGVEFSFQSEIIKEKSKKTLQEKYGVDYAQQSPEIKEKTREKNITKYGATTPLNNPFIREKIKAKLIEKYGVDNPLKNENIKSKMIKTCMEKYGVTNYHKTDECKEKIKTTMIKRYGVPNVAYLNVNNYHNFTPEFISQNFIINEELQESQVKDYFNFQSIKPVLKLLDTSNIKYKRQPKGTRTQRDFLYQFLQIYYTNMEYEKTIKPYRVDGFISPENFENSTIVVDFKIPQTSRGLIIEYLGDYWHGKSNDAKINEKCNKTAMQLFCETQERFRYLNNAGYTVVYQWESDYSKFGLKLKIFKGILE